MPSDKAGQAAIEALILRIGNLQDDGSEGDPWSQSELDLLLNGLVLLRSAQSAERHNLPPMVAGDHPRGPWQTRDEIELFLRDAYAAGCSAAQSRSLFTAMEYAAREAPKLRAILARSTESASGDRSDG